MMQIRRSDERGHANYGWLDTRYTFSFADYHDPKHMGFRTLRVINEDRVNPRGGFGAHPHRDMEILTYVLSGALTHKDSMGHVSTLRANEFQRMSAGTGIVHSEYNDSRTDPVHLLQIWIRPEEHGITPSYEQMALPPEEKNGKLRLVAAPKGDGNGILRIQQDARVLVGAADPGETLEYSLASGRGAWVHLIRGRAEVNGTDLKAGDAAALTGETALQIRSLAPESEAIVFDLA
jgi:redox-sensitive bicupin YhaK (pirin superfamily)